LVIEDDSGTPEKGSAGLRKLVTQDQVVAVVGQFHSSVMTAVQALAEQFKVPVFSTQASAPPFMFPTLSGGRRRIVAVYSGGEGLRSLLERLGLHDARGAPRSSWSPPGSAR
jgi:hypothetical protein